MEKMFAWLAGKLITEISTSVQVEKLEFQATNFNPKEHFELVESFKDDDGLRTKVGKFKCKYLRYVEMICVIRSYDVTDRSDEEVASIRKKMALHLQLKHPNIAKSFKIMENGEGIHLVQEYVENGKISEYFGRHPATEDEARRMILGLLLAIGYLQEAGIRMKHFSTNSVMVDGSGRLIITDYNLQYCTESKQQLSQFNGRTDLDTLMKLSQLQIADDMVIDVQVLAEILYLLVTGKDLPKEDRHDWNAYDFAEETNITFRLLIFEMLNENNFFLKHFLESEWMDLDMSERKRAKAVVQKSIGFEKLRDANRRSGRRLNSEHLVVLPVEPAASFEEQMERYIIKLRRRNSMTK